MERAIHKRTNELVVANDRLNKIDYYICPECKTRVSLRRGDYRVAYFAHNSTDAVRKDCQLYTQGDSFYNPRIFTPTRQTIPIEQSTLNTEKHDMFVDLCIRDTENSFNLYLSIPNPSLKSRSNISFKELQKVKIHLTADNIHIHRVSIIKLFTTGIKTEFDVKPTEKKYVIKIINDSSVSVDLGFCEESINGLSPLGNLFGKIDDEWIRIHPHSAVEWGSEFYFVVDQNVTVPLECNPIYKGVKSGYSRNWKFWRINLPSIPDNKVEDWLKKIGYSPVEARWKLRLLSIPQAFDPRENICYFDSNFPILLKAESPSPFSKTNLICESWDSDEVTNIRSDSENNCYFTVEANIERIFLEEYEETQINIDFLDDSNTISIIPNLLALPALNLRIGKQCFQNFSGVNNEHLEMINLRDSIKLEDIDIMIHPEELNQFVKHSIDIHFWGDKIISRYDCSFVSAREEILKLINNRQSGVLIIDAASLGVIKLKLQLVTAKIQTVNTPSKVSNWISVYSSSIGNQQAVGANTDINQFRDDKNLTYKIAHNRSALVSIQARAMLKRKKG